LPEISSICLGKVLSGLEKNKREYFEINFKLVKKESGQKRFFQSQTCPLRSDKGGEFFLNTANHLLMSIEEDS